MGSYRRLFEIEKSFRMSKSDVQARPIYHRKRGSIDAHLTIVFAALVVSRWIEARTGWSITPREIPPRHRPTHARAWPGDLERGQMPAAGGRAGPAFIAPMLATPARRDVSVGVGE
jgi:hypothetical protein